MPKTPLQRIQDFERKIMEKGPQPFKFILSKELRLELEAHRGFRPISHLIRKLLEQHCHYVAAPPGEGQMTLFDDRENFERVFAYETRLRQPKGTAYKIVLDPELRLLIEHNRDDQAIADFMRAALSKRCAYMGDPLIQNQMSLDEYLNLSAEEDRRANGESL